VRPSVDLGADDARKAEDARQAVLGLEQELADLEAAHASSQEIAPLRHELADLKARLDGDLAKTASTSGDTGAAAGADLPDLLHAETTQIGSLQARVAAARKELADAETALARDALHRLDLRRRALPRR
jgi:ElaB/YqjD/DUF883 family membrane-anchored ribosome-binding protein